MIGLYLGIAALSLSISSAQATVILNVDGSGQLTGAENVDVGCVLYDVTFVEGTCVSIFDGCDPADFDFNTFDDANDAVQALFAQVFTDDDPALGLFDTFTALTKGCELDFACSTQIPFGFRDDGELKILAAQNHDNEPETIALITLFLANDTNSFLRPGTNWARFCKVGEICPPIVEGPPPRIVPEPPTLALFVMGLAGLGFMMRRRRST